MNEVSHANGASPREVTTRVPAAALGRPTLLCELITQELPLDDVLGALLKLVSERLGVPSSSIFFHDWVTYTSNLQVSYYQGAVLTKDQMNHPFAGRPWPLPKTPTAVEQALLDTFVPARFTVESAVEIDEPTRAWMKTLGLKTVYVLPLVHRGQAIGDLILRTQDLTPFSDERLALAEALASEATIAVHFIRLAEQSRQSGILREREKIVRDIHDTLGQTFTGIVIQSQAAQKHLEPGEARAHVETAIELARQGLSDARRAVKGMRSELLSAMDLPRALATLVERMLCGTGIRSQVRVHGDPVTMAPFVDDNLLRITQEALANAVRHGECHHVAVTLSFLSGAVALSIDDDGVGFQLDQWPTATEGIGLKGMRTRTEELAGSFRIETALGKGTAVIVKVPLAR